MDNMFYAFPPLVGDDPKILILGTFPSPMSRGRREYYGNPRNRFWRVLFTVLGLTFDAPDYDEKCRAACDNGIAIWDTLLSCSVEGALDSAIKNPVFNTGIPRFIAQNGIETVIFNGGYAEKFYLRANPRVEGVRYIKLPSTSPANARTGFEALLERWSAVLGM